MLETVLTFILRAAVLPGWETVALFSGFAVLAVLAVWAERAAGGQTV
jgi:hypothetical protein